VGGGGYLRMLSLMLATGRICCVAGQERTPERGRNAVAVGESGRLPAGRRTGTSAPTMRVLNHRGGGATRD